MAHYVSQATCQERYKTRVVRLQSSYLVWEGGMFAVKSFSF